jgi:superfamily II DNA/RNA helicase
VDYRYVQVRAARDKPGLLRNLIVTHALSNCIAYCGSATKLRSVVKDLRRGGVSCELYFDGLSIDEKRLVVEHFNNGAVTCILTSSVRALLRYVKTVDSLVFCDLPRSAGEYVECYSLPDTLGTATPVITLVTDREMPQLRKIEEKIEVTMAQDELPTEEEVMEGEIKELLRRIKEEENPEELNAIRGVIRKNVSVFNRMYLASMLLKEHLNRKGTAKGRFTTLFVGVGKNRKVFPKDLSQLFSDNANVPKSDVGDIKILDNYSFVEVASKHAKPAIDLLNGMDFRGRKLTVNYARKKEDKKNKGSERKSSRPSE